MTTDDDGLFPAWDETGDARNDNWFTEDCSIEDISNSPIGGSPHLLQFEFYGQTRAKIKDIKPSTRASSGVIVAHLIPTLYFWIAWAASIVT